MNGSDTEQSRFTWTVIRKEEEEGKRVVQKYYNTMLDLGRSSACQCAPRSRIS